MYVFMYYIMLNKNTLGVRKYEARYKAKQEQHCKWVHYANKIFGINWGQEIIYQWYKKVD